MVQKYPLIRVFAVMVLLVNLLLVDSVVPSLASAQSPSSDILGGEVVVGAFNIHVQLARQRVRVTTIEDGDLAAALPVTELVAQFINWDKSSGVVSISIAIQNNGTKTLYHPLNALVVKTAPPFAVPINPDSGTGPGSWRWEYDTLLAGDGLLSPGEVSDGKQWDFFDGPGRDFQITVQIFAGVPLAPGEGGTILGEGGTSVTVQPNSIPYEVLIDIAPASLDEVVAPLGELELGGAVELTYQPAAFNASLLPPNAPLQISIPAPTQVVGTEFIVAHQVLSDFFGEGEEPGLREQAVAVDTATLLNGNLVTEAEILPGIFGDGLYMFLSASGSGYATGIVSDATGPRPGAVVSNSTNTLVSIANASGQYTLFISGGPFSVTGFDPFRGSMGSSTGNIAVSGSTVTADISLTPLATPPITRDGIRNSGFERGDLTSWAIDGAALATQQLGPTSTGVVIQPTEGQWMADVHTGAGAVGGVGSSLKQRFIVPAGVRTLRLDFNFVSEEFPEFVGSIFNDAFRATITTPNGETTFAEVSVNQSGGFTLIGDCFFPGGDDTCGQTGWRQGSIDVSAFAGTNTPIQVDLLFTANDAGDNIYDTHILIDNIRFATVWVDANIIQGANADNARIQNEVRGANEILSQAGLNIRVRNIQTIADPGGLLDTDITWTTGAACADGRVNGRLTTEEQQLMGLSRSATTTDVNVYYVRSGTGLGGVGGFAIGPDDFCVDVNILTNSGTLQMDIGVGGNILAHELGHLLIAPQTAGNNLEHSAAAGNFLSTTPALGTVNRQQSENINRTGAPLLVP